MLFVPQCSTNPGRRLIPLVGFTADFVWSKMFLVLNFHVLYCFYFWSWDQQTALTSIHQDLRKEHWSAVKGTYHFACFQTLLLEYIFTVKRGLMEMVRAFFFLPWSPLGGWTVNKARVKAAEVQRECLCAKSFLSSLSVRNAVQFASTFLWEIGWFPFCSRVRSFRNMPVLISPRIPPV